MAGDGPSRFTLRPLDLLWNVGFLAVVGGAAVLVLSLYSNEFVTGFTSSARMLLDPVVVAALALIALASFYWARSASTDPVERVEREYGD